MTNTVRSFNYSRSWRKAASCVLAVATAAAFTLPGGVTMQSAFADDAVNIDDGIDNAAELVAFAADVNGGNSYAGQTVKLNADIDMSGVAMASIGTSDSPFAGRFDGQTFKISGVSTSLFGVAVGASSNLAKISNLYVQGAITEAGSNVGGVVGYGSYLQLDSVGADVDITGTDETATGIGGLVGYAHGTWNSMYNRPDGSVEIYRSFSRGDIDVKGSKVGGLIGDVTANKTSSTSRFIEFSYSTGKVSGGANVGGLAGIIENSTESTSSWYVTSMPIRYSYSASQVSGTSAVGAVIGVHEGASFSSDFYLTQGALEASSEYINGNEPEGKTADELKAVTSQLGAGTNVAFTDDVTNLNGGYPIHIWDAKASGVPAIDISKYVFQTNEPEKEYDKQGFSLVLTDMDGKEVPSSAYTVKYYTDEGLTSSANTYGWNNGTYYAVAEGAGMYEGTTAAVKLVIKKKVLQATYVSETLVSGDTPKLEVTVTGWVGDDGPDSWSDDYTAPTVSLPEGGVEGGKSYELTPSGGSYSSGYSNPVENYEFNYVSGTLTVIKSAAELSAELEKAQVDLAAAQDELNKAKADLDTANERLEAAEAQIESVRKELDKAVGDNSALQESLDALQKQLDAVKAELETATKKLEDSVSGNEAKQKEISDLTEKLAKAETERGALEKSSASADSEIAKLKASLAKAAVGLTYTKAGASYKILSADTIAYAKYAGKKKSVTIPATVTVNGRIYKVASVSAKAFAKTKVKKVTVKSPLLKTKKSVKKSLKGSKVKTVKVKVSGSDKKAVVKAFKKKGWTGKKVTVK